MRPIAPVKKRPHRPLWPRQQQMQAGEEQRDANGGEWGHVHAPQVADHDVAFECAESEQLGEATEGQASW